jgi:hypothetical protein
MKGYLKGLDDDSLLEILWQPSLAKTSMQDPYVHPRKIAKIAQMGHNNSSKRSSAESLAASCGARVSTLTLQ